MNPQDTNVPAPDQTNPNPAAATPPEPQQPAVEPTAHPLAPVAEAPATAAPAVAPVPGQPAMAQSANSMAASQGKPKKGLIIAIGAAVAAIIIALVVCWFVFWSPAARSKHAADVFAKSMTTGNLQMAQQLVSDGSSSDTQEFLKHSSDVTAGTKARRIESTFIKGVRYSLYQIDGSEYYVRVTVEKEDGRWLASGYDYSKNKLALVPGKPSSKDTKKSSTDTAKAPSTTAPKETPTPASSAGACFGPNDFLALNSIPQTASSDGKYMYYDSIFFAPNSTAYAYPGNMPDTYAKYKQFYQANSSKQFTIAIAGEVNGSAEDGLANGRAAVVKQAFISQSGIPASRISVGAPKNYAGSLGSGDTGAQNRAVNIKIASPEGCQ